MTITPTIVILVAALFYLPPYILLALNTKNQRDMMREFARALLSKTAHEFAASKKEEQRPKKGDPEPQIDSSFEELDNLSDEEFLKAIDEFGG